MWRKLNKRRTKFTRNKCKYKACVLGKILNLPRSPGRLTNSLRGDRMRGAVLSGLVYTSAYWAIRFVSLYLPEEFHHAPAQQQMLGLITSRSFPLASPGRAPETPALPQPPQATQLR